MPRLKKSVSWTQPVCDSCWEGYVMKNTGEYKEPARVTPKKEECCFCRFETESGIFVRVDPAVCPHPTRKE